jgi:parallel beta-helix repeat protein
MRTKVSLELLGLFVTGLAFDMNQATQSAFAGGVNPNPVQIISQSSGKCLETVTLSGMPAVVQNACNNQLTQQWQMTPAANGNYQIVSKSSGMCFDVGGSSQLDGGLVYFSSCIQGKVNQTFTLKTLSGAQQMIALHSGKCMDISAFNSSDGLQLQQWACNADGQSNQLWNFKPALTPSGPLVISGKKNVVVQGLKISNPAGPCILVTGNSQNIVIKDSELGPCQTDSKNPKADLSNLGIGVMVIGSSNVTVDNLSIYDTDDAGVSIFYGSNFSVTNNSVKNTKSQAIKAQGLSNVLIQNNTLTAVQSGVYVAAASGVTVEKNNLSHIQGTPRANFVQFNNVSGGANKIACNIGYQDDYGTKNSLDSIEDTISLYRSNGTASQPILVVGNKVKGGGPSSTGSGIMLGDSGGSYIVARDNVVVNPAGGGIMVSGGTQISVENNKVYAQYTPLVNNALAVWNYNTNGVVCDSITVKGNQTNWINTWGPDLKIWGNNTCTNLSASNNSFADRSVSPSLFDTYTSPECQ